MSRFHGETDTIAARATPPGEGAIAVVRISGPLSHSIMNKCFKKHARDNSDKYNYITLGFFFHPEKKNPIDEVFRVLFRSPHSYTGEDSAEIYCHGSPAVVSGILEALFSLGARHAEPGEFTRRAFLNGKMDLTEAEAVCDLIRARTDKAARLAFKQLEGGLAQKVRAIRQKVISASAEIEASLDFPDESGNYHPDKIIRELSDARQDILDLLEQGRKARIYRKGAKVVLTGRPNTGKSSLFNDLLKMERAIVTAHPGTTRDSIEGTVDLEGCPVTFVDTAGIRTDAGEIERLGMDRTHREMSQADLVLFLIDISEPLLPEDFKILNRLEDQDMILILNKCDLKRQLKDSELDDFRVKASHEVKVSALTGDGLRELEREIIDMLLSDAQAEENEIVTNERHNNLLSQSADELFAAIEGLHENRFEELIMINLREASLFLARITGEETGDEVLDVIFSRFCIGK